MVGMGHGPRLTLGKGSHVLLEIPGEIPHTNLVYSQVSLLPPRLFLRKQYHPSRYFFFFWMLKFDGNKNLGIFWVQKIPSHPTTKPLPNGPSNFPPPWPQVSQIWATSNAVTRRKVWSGKTVGTEKPVK